MRRDGGWGVGNDGGNGEWGEGESPPVSLRGSDLRVSGATTPEEEPDSSVIPQLRRWADVGPPSLNASVSSSGAVLKYKLIIPWWLSSGQFFSGRHHTQAHRVHV